MHWSLDFYKADLERLEVGKKQNKTKQKTKILKRAGGDGSVVKNTAPKPCLLTVNKQAPQEQDRDIFTKKLNCTVQSQDTVFA